MNHSDNNNDYSTPVTSSRCCHRCLFLQSCVRTFTAFDPSHSGRITIDFGQVRAVGALLAVFVGLAGIFSNEHVFILRSSCMQLHTSRDCIAQHKSCSVNDKADPADTRH